MKQSDPDERISIVELAKEAIGEYVSRQIIIETPDPSELEEPVPERAGVFVSLKKEGALRGCIGTFKPTKETITDEVITNAISAATKDPRFRPVRPDELDHLQISVDVLSDPEPIASISELNPKKYGIIITCGQRRGLLLPNIEGVTTVEDQIAITMKKAGITEGLDRCRIFRFEVERFH